MTEPTKSCTGLALLVSGVGFLGALAGSIVGSLITFYVLAPAREAKAVVDVGVQGAKEGIDLLRQAIPKPTETAVKHDPNDKSEDPVEAARYYFDNIWAGRQEATGYMSKSSYSNDSVFNFIKRNPLPPREKALERVEVEEVPGIDEKTRVFKWKTATANGVPIELKVIVVRASYKSDFNPFWWSIERTDLTELPRPADGFKK